MKSEINRQAIWNEGAKAGLIIGGISAAYMCINMLTGSLTANGSAAAAMLISVLNVVLWAAKLLGIIFLMKYFMRKLVSSYEGVSNSDTFKFGAASALLSALIYAGFYLAWVLFIEPEALSQALDLAMQQYSQMFDSASKDAIAEMKGSLPQITFISNFIYCTLYGVILSAIISRNIPSSNPFYNPSDEQ